MQKRDIPRVLRWAEKTYTVLKEKHYLPYYARIKKGGPSSRTLCGEKVWCPVGRSYAKQGSDNSYVSQKFLTKSYN